MNRSCGKTSGVLLVILLLTIAACYTVYNNKDFQRANRKEIAKVKFYLRDYSKAFNDFSKDLGGKIAQWEKFIPFQKKDPKAPKPLESRTFEELIYGSGGLEKEIPAEMVRHQPDEITICSFNADFLFNNPLTDDELLHIANIMRFCELSTITQLQNESFVKKISSVLKLLRYNAVYDFSPPVGKTSKTFYAFLYRDDKVQPQGKAKLLTNIDSIPVAPYYGTFKSGDFDFTIVTFATAPAGTEIDSLLPLENLYEKLKYDHPEIADIMFFGDFAFESRSVVWDSNAFLPTIARTAKTDGSPHDLSGNFWILKNDLIEFNGKSGLINIPEEAFPSKRKPPLSGPKPLWVQFRAMPDDDQ